MATAPIQSSSRDPVKALRNDYTNSYPHSAADESLSYDDPRTGASDAEKLSCFSSRHEHKIQWQMLTPNQSPRHASFSPNSSLSSRSRTNSRPTTPASAPVQKDGTARGPAQHTPAPNSSRRPLTAPVVHRYEPTGPEHQSHRDHAHALYYFPSAPAHATAAGTIPAETTAAMIAMDATTTTATTTPMPTQAIAVDSGLNVNDDLFGRSECAALGPGQPRGSHVLEQNSNPISARAMQNQPIDERGHRSPHHSTPPAKHTLAHKSKSYSPSSEGGTAISVDMKRLMSKPAPPSPGTRSLAGSDSDPPQPYRPKMASKSRSEGGEDGRSRSQPLVPQLPQLPFQHRSSSLSSPSSALTPRTDTAPAEDTRSQTSTQKNTRRNVLKRKPSAARVPSNTSSASSSSAPRHAGSALRIDSDLARGAKHIPAPLTPAGAVAEAYKQQEQRRASAASGDDLATPRAPNQQFDSDLQGGGKSQPSSPMPYYSVIGTTSGRLIAVGGPSDRWLDGYNANQRPRTSPNTSEVSPSPVRSLSRKISARWKRTTSGLKPDSTPPGSSNSSALSRSMRLEEDASNEPAGRRSASLPRERTKSGGSGVRGEMKSPDSQSYGRPRASESSSTAWVTVGVPEGVDEHGRVRGGSSPTKGKEEGGKMWKLMKRISTSGLRDKYHVEKNAPPVPSLPKDFVHRSWTQGSGDSGGSPTGGLSRFISRSSLSTPVKSPLYVSPVSMSPAENKVVSTGRRPSEAATGSSSPVSSDFASSRFFHRTHSARSSTSSLGDILPPPLPNTMVSKHIIPPNELRRVHADLESDTRIALGSPSHHKAHRSATMPEGDVPPPGRSPDESRLGRLPLPPRRATATGQQLTYQSNPQYQTQPSPDIPLFSNVGSINTFPSHAIAAHAGQSERAAQSATDLRAPPPALPVKSAKRLTHASVSHTQASIVSKSNPADNDASRRSHDVRPVRDNGGTGRPILHRKSSDAASATPTTKAGNAPQFSAASPRTQPLGAAIRPSSSKRSPLTFREADTAAKPPLTAQQKAEIWDTLLERSERAGGTLHLGEQELVSDRMKMESSLSFYADSL
ncbi:hypothetical protein FIBSPDRAFT_877194 [Athelia psychrophila]|uniref:Uncharacterized protein n=1 Tax=Athelia psychrophila TaxID=1759441 RepID=A0A167W6G2_9AGAM|nr:hypothetical protein FIBSPDRAFT_877194 [Fibularhizoctonia sp. CBS 109695]